LLPRKDVLRQGQEVARPSFLDQPAAEDPHMKVAARDSRSCRCQGWGRLRSWAAGLWNHPAELAWIHLQEPGPFRQSGGVKPGQDMG
jgi:hypothetical protein